LLNERRRLVADWRAEGEVGEGRTNRRRRATERGRKGIS
jgi:hypothetical protein